MTTLYCPYCGEPAECIASKEYYGKDFGWLWICKPCQATVGCHGKSKRPKGELANAEVRALRRRVHSAFDPLWRRKGMTRRAAYRWLSEAMFMLPEACHIGMFDKQLCLRAIEALKDRVKK